MGLNQASNRGIQAAQTALTLAQELNQPQKEAEPLSSIGANYTLLNNPTKSLEFFERALAIHKATQNKVGQIQALIQAMRANVLMAHAAEKQKDDSQNLKLANQILALADEALQLTRELDKPTFESQILEQQSIAYSLIGEVYWKLGDFGKAEEVAHRAIEIGQKSESLFVQNRALALLSVVYDAQGEYGKLIKVTQQNLDIACRSDAFFEVHALLTVGNSYALFGNLPRAIEFIRQALSKAEAIASQPTSPDIHSLMLAAQTLALGSLSVHYRLLGEYDQALEFAQQCLHLARTTMKPEEELKALIDLGRVYATRQSLPQAIEATQQALAIAQAVQSSAIPNQSHLEINVLVQLSQLYAAQENHAKALEVRTTSIANRPEKRQT
ncbi:tetratricopeptide repeat protein [Leptothermofonsia sp. ETS-13]|uniref:tetratricopeptide repeat protein n=1 Tax=Leptothermofonsia sp. ETS-13 TaxID=3035696 RepID=UPI003BA2691F